MNYEKQLTNAWNAYFKGKRFHQVSIRVGSDVWRHYNEMVVNKPAVTDLRHKTATMRHDPSLAPDAFVIE